MVEHATTFNRVLMEFLGRAETAYQELTEVGSQPEEALATG